MIDLYGVLQEQETINGELGLGVDYYKGEKGDTPIKGVDYLTPDDVKEISDKVLEQVEAGTKGEDGKSAYQIALDEGFEGSEAEWLASLKGTDGRNGIDGINGTNGKDGKTPVKGVDYFTTAEINEIEEGAAAKVDLSNYAKTADLSTVATSGSYNDLSDKPPIPEPYELPVASATALGGVKVGSGLSITDGVLSATGGGTADSVDWSKIQNKPNFANVATSGDYNDLSNKPTIPSVEGLASEAYVNEKVAAIVIPEVPTKVSELENDKGYLTEHQSLEGYAKTADLAQVAKTGSYNDLIDKPTIPSTTGLATETYVDDKIAEIDIPTVPTKVSAFTNDAGYLTEHQSLIEYAKKTDIPAPYALPTASTSTLGGVKVDGNTITIADGVISSVGGSGGSEPEKYIKDASVSGNTLTLTKRDDTEVVFTPSGGSGGDGSSYTLPVADMNTLGGIKVRLEPVKNEQINKIGTPLIYNEDVLTTAYIPKATVSYPGVVQLPASTNGLYINVVGDLDIKEATTTNLGTVAFDGITIKQNDNKVKQLYAATATASSLGVVKPDGTTTTVDSQGNLSMIGKPAVTKTLITGEAPNWVVDWVANPDKYIVIVNNCVVFKTMKSGTNFYYYWIDGDRIEYYYITFTDTTFTTPNSSQPSYSMAATQLITADNWQNYITAGGGSDWQTTTYIGESNLYNAKEMIIYWEYNTEYRMNYYNFTYNSNLASYANQTFNVKYDYSNGNSSWYYDGNQINTSNMNIQVIYYKT